MKGFIVYPTYKEEKGKAFVYLFGRLQNGKAFMTRNYFKPYFFIKTSDVSKAKKLVKVDFENTELKNFEDNKLTKVSLDIPKDVKLLRETFEDHKIKSYESDIRFEYRFMIDNKLQGSIEIKGESNSKEGIEVYEEPSLKSADFIPKLKTVAIDIESSMDLKNIYCVSIYSKEYKRVLLVSKKKVANAISFPTEKLMLERFKEVINSLDPDIITGWNLIDFDLNLLQKKFRKYKIKFELGRMNWPCSLRIESGFIRDSKADFPGRMILDGIRMLKTSFVNLPDYKLDTAAEKFAGKKKTISFKNKGQEIEELYKNNQAKLVKYNLTDSELVIKILENSGVLDLTIQRSLLTGMPLDRVMASIASLDSVYLKKLRDKGYVAPTLKFKEVKERTTGGFVMQSKPGIYDFVIVCDFKSLYPSIVRTFNIDPLTFVPKNKAKGNVIIAHNKAGFKMEEGILPEIIQHLWEEREKARKSKNELARYAIKILMNSFYGVLASPNCRFYNYDLTNAITSFGHYIIQTSAKLIEKQGYEVIYGDTDSIFINLNVNTEKQAENIGKKIEKNINSYFDKHVKEFHKRNSFLELEFEKTYIRFLMPRVRGSEKGAKKRYAGLLEKNGKEKIDFTGLEFVRRDWTELSKKFQLELLDRIFHKKEVANFVKKFVDNLRNGKFDSLLVYIKALRKPVSEYVKTTPPHVKAAKLLDKIDDTIIKYVMTENGPEPVQKLKSKIDYEHYIKKQIKPLADSVLGFYSVNFDDLLKGNKQKTLFSY